MCYQFCRYIYRKQKNMKAMNSYSLQEKELAAFAAQIASIAKGDDINPPLYTEGMWKYYRR